MKKKSSILPAFCLFLLALAVQGCKRYTCECTGHNTNSPEIMGQSSYLVKGNKKKRKEACENKTTQPDKDGNYTTCVIK